MALSVAVIGAGAMGAPMAECIHQAGIPLTVCDSSETALTKFASLGVHTTTTPSDCASADVILVVVATPDQTRDVILGVNGILAGLPLGHAPVLAVMGTVSREVILGIDQDLSSSSIRLLDAPISGGPVRAEQGALTAIVGGESASLDAAAPVLDVICRQVFHCGPVGSGQAVKIINNLIGVVNVVVVGEAYRIALENGLTIEDIAPVLEASSGRTNLSADAAEAYISYARWARDERDFLGVKRVMQKDMRLALEMATSSPGSYPATREMLKVVEELGKETSENWRTVGQGAHPAVE